MDDLQHVHAVGAECLFIKKKFERVCEVYEEGSVVASLSKREDYCGAERHSEGYDEISEAKMLHKVGEHARSTRNEEVGGSGVQGQRQGNRARRMRDEETGGNGVQGHLGHVQFKIRFFEEGQLAPQNKEKVRNGLLIITVELEQHDVHTLRPRGT